MSLLDLLISLVAPHKCLGCGREGTLLCKMCRLTLPAAPTGCTYCGLATSDERTCASCRRNTSLQVVRAATTYQGAGKAVVKQLKFHGAQAAARLMAQSMTPLLPAGRVIVVPVPTASQRVRQRGFDQALLLARELARLSGNQYENCLRRVGQTHQVGADRKQRQRQLIDAFRVQKMTKIAGAHVVLVDDVFTTGATLISAASAVGAAQPETISAIVFARTP